MAHSFVELGFCASVTHLLEHPSGRLRRGSLRKAFAFLRCISAQPTFLTACRFRCRTASFHSVSSAELCLAHHGFRPFFSFCKMKQSPLPYRREYTTKRKPKNNLLDKKKPRFSQIPVGKHLLGYGQSKFPRALSVRTVCRVSQSIMYGASRETCTCIESGKSLGGFILRNIA